MIWELLWLVVFSVWLKIEELLYHHLGPTVANALICTLAIVANGNYCHIEFAYGNVVVKRTNQNTSCRSSLIFISFQYSAAPSVQDCTHHRQDMN